jgi:hypothetical protein
LGGNWFSRVGKYLDRVGGQEWNAPRRDRDKGVPTMPFKKMTMTQCTLRSMTDLIVMKIVVGAKAGELDPDRLCNQVLLELEKRPAA